jgi:hypothetical protein
MNFRQGVFGSSLGHQNSCTKRYSIGRSQKRSDLEIRESWCKNRPWRYCDLSSKKPFIWCIDLDNSASLVEAFKGVDVVVSTLSGEGFGQQFGVLHAAKEAGVKRFVPSEFGIDILKAKDIALFGPKLKLREEIQKGGIEYTYIVTGFFTDGTFFAWTGFDWPNGKVVLLGDGNAKISLSATTDFVKLVPEICTNNFSFLHSKLTIE